MERNHKPGEFPWLAHGHTTPKPWSWDLTPGGLSNFGKRHFGRGDLDGELGHMMATGRNRCWEEGWRGEGLLILVWLEIWCHLQETSPKHQKLPSIWMGRRQCQFLPILHVLLISARGEQKKKKFHLLLLLWMLILSHLTGKFKGLIPSFLLYPSFRLSFSFFLSLFSSLPLFLSSITYILSSYYVLSILLGNKQKRQCLIIMGLPTEWEDRGQTNMKILKITTTVNAIKERERMLGRCLCARGIWPSLRLSGKTSLENCH